MSEENTNNNLTNDSYGYKEEIEYVGFWIRVGAALIDVIVMIPIIVLNSYNQFNIKSIILLYLLAVLSALYKPLMEWRFGATLGKMACKIKVVSEALKPISIDQSFGRYMPWAISVIIQLLVATQLFGMSGFQNATTFMEIGVLAQDLPLSNISTIYSFIFLGLICWLIFDKKSQGIHDKIAKTMVIKVRK